MLRVADVGTDGKKFDQNTSFAAAFVFVVAAVETVAAVVTVVAAVVEQFFSFVLFP